MEKNPSRLFQALAAPLTTGACLICVAIFIGLSDSGTTWEAAQQWGHFPDFAVWEGKPWALITSAFVHRETWHIVFNLYWLWILGSFFETTLGSLRWLLFLVASAWVSAAAELLLGGSGGIGMSGVGYALFGFGWVARRKLTQFADILNDQIALMFVLWLLFCFALTNFGLMQVANWAHLFGLAFGAAVAALFITHWRPVASAGGLAALLAISFVPLVWCPNSADWTALQASQAHDRKDYVAAANWYRRSLSLGNDPEWGWANLAHIYGFQEDKVKYAEAVTELRKVNEGAADRVVARYGAPGVQSPGSQSPGPSSEAR